MMLIGMKVVRVVSSHSHIDISVVTCTHEMIMKLPQVVEIRKSISRVEINNADHLSTDSLYYIHILKQQPLHTIYGSRYTTINGRSPSNTHAEWTPRQCAWRIIFTGPFIRHEETCVSNPKQFTHINGSKWGRNGGRIYAEQGIIDARRKSRCRRNNDGKIN